METKYTCIAERSQSDLARCFRDWFNNYLSTAAFAAAYGVKQWEAVALINAGRIEHENGF